MFVSTQQKSKQIHVHYTATQYDVCLYALSEWSAYVLCVDKQQRLIVNIIMYVYTHANSVQSITITIILIVMSTSYSDEHATNDAHALSLRCCSVDYHKS